VKTFLRLVLAGALLFAVLEATTRLMLFGPIGLDLRRIGPNAVGARDLVTFETDPSLLFEFEPNQERLLPLNSFRTNSRGLRDREYPIEKPDDSFRVAVIGSSFTLPSGVEIEDAFHSVLEERLSAEFAPNSFEFLNFAIGMHFPSQFVAMLRQRALQYDPDLVLVSAAPMSAPLFLREWNRPVSPRIFNFLPSKTRSMLVVYARSQMDMGPEPGGSPKWLSTPMKAKSVVDVLGEISRSTGIPIVVVRLSFDSEPESAGERRLAKQVVESDLYYLDTRSAFRGRDPHDFWIYALDPHPNREAHAIFADVIETFLRGNQLLGVANAPD